MAGGVRRSLPFPGGMSKRVARASPSSPRQRSLAAGVVVGITLRHTDDAAPAAGPEGPAAGAEEPAGAVGPADRAGLQGLAEGQHRRDAAARSAVSEERPSVQLYRGVALIWAGYPSDAQIALERGEEARPRHDHPGVGPTTCSTRRTSSPAVRRATRSSSRRGRTGCSSRARGCRRRGTRSRPSACTSGRRAGARATTRRRSPPAVGPLRRGQPDARVLAPRATHAALSAQPVRAVLPRPAPRLDGAVATRRSSSSRRSSRSTRRPGSASPPASSSPAPPPAARAPAEPRPPAASPSDAAETVPASPVPASGVGARRRS